MNILIIGAGNGGLAFGAKLIENGFRVNLYDKFSSIVQPIINNNNEVILSDDNESRKVQFQLVTTNLQESLINVKFIFVVVPAFAHQSIATDLSKFILDEHIVILHPGRTGGALEVKNIFTKNDRKRTLVAEAETLLFACRKVKDTEIRIYGIKKSVGIAALPSSSSALVTEELNKMLPYFHNMTTVFATSFSNIGAILHPAPLLFNISRIECKETFKYYHEGITPTISKLLEELDKERVLVAKTYGFQIPSALEWLNNNYELIANNLFEAIQSNQSYNEIYTPLERSPRYIMEDVPMSLVPLSQFATLAKVDTPIMNSIIELATHMFDCDFRKTGRTLEKMGLNSKTFSFDLVK